MHNTIKKLEVGQNSNFNIILLVHLIYKTVGNLQLDA